MLILLLATSVVSSRDGSSRTLDFAARPWMDATKTPDERVELLLPQLSLEEKVFGLIIDCRFVLPWVWVRARISLGVLPY